MHVKFTIPLISLFLLLAVPVCAQFENSVLSSGRWFKVAVSERGVYKITHGQLQQMGFADVNPKKIRIYGNAGGMLSQRNDELRPKDLIENAIYVSGQADGVLDSHDYVLFFAEGPDRVSYDLSRKIFSYENNLYDDRNFYFITVGDEDGRRIQSIENLEGQHPTITTYEDYFYHEVDQNNILFSGREWFGPRFDARPEQSAVLNVNNIASGSNIKFVSDVVSQTYAEASIKLSWNNADIGTQQLLPIPNTQYGIKGLHRRDTLTFSESSVGATSSSQQNIKFQFVRAGSGASNAYLDFFLASFKRNLNFTGNQVIFRSEESVEHAASTFKVAQVPSEVFVWNVTTPHDVREQKYIYDGSTISFSAASDELQEYAIFNTSVASPELIGEVQNQNLAILQTPALLIITHTDFVSEANRLATHRTQHSGWETAVVTTEQIYNEFSSGRQDVTAIRDFIKMLYDRNSDALKAVLLFGKGSYDYKNRIDRNTNFVPTYESRNSLSPLATYSSDDYFAFLEDHEGEWGESPVQNHTLDIGVGRLPVKSVAEAKTIVDKIIYYDTNVRTYGNWRKTISFVGDDGNNTDDFTISHQSQANAMAASIESSNAQFDTKRIFLGTYEKTSGSSGEAMPKVNDAIVEKFDRGSLIINFTGHGNEFQWTDEKVFSESEIKSLRNKLYPFLVTATCEFGRQDDPRIVSGAEQIVLKGNGGAIGMVTTARPVNAGSNFLLNQQFYAALFEKGMNGHRSLGEVFLHTKNNSMRGVANRNFSLLGDPSMTLAMPAGSIDAQIKTVSGSDTLTGLSKVRLQGEVQDEYGEVDAGFNGVVQFTLYDKETEVSTIGKNNPPFVYKEWSNILYRGKASVVNGVFDFEFLLTKNLNKDVSFGKLSLYAFDSDSDKDASGALTSVKIGSVEADVTADHTPPTIIPYMGDSTFESGGIVNTNSTLFVELSDDSGINISGSGDDNALVAYLDGGAEIFLLNDYYEADTDDFTRGTVLFPVRNLAPGRHTITVKAWDTHNNMAEATIEFVVTDGEGIVVETLGSYPNPFQSETTVFFTHNRPGDDLDVTLTVYSADGLSLKTYQVHITESPYRVEVLELNDVHEFGKNPAPGVYLGRLVVRSLSNGSKSERVTKFIVVN